MPRPELNTPEAQIPPVSANMSIDDQLKYFQLEELKRQFAKRSEDDKVTKAMHESGAKAMQQKRDQELSRQNNCSHMKPWGGSAIAGQRDHAQMSHWICQFCWKEWKGTELPSNLRIPAEKVGGPDN